jgi:hypothetical protein
MTVAELLGRITSTEIAEWMAYYSIDPFGEIRGDMRSAMQCCLMANAWNGDKNKTFSMDDFMLIKESESKPKESGFSGEAGAAIAKRIFPRGKK